MSDWREQTRKRLQQLAREKQEKEAKQRVGAAGSGSYSSANKQLYSGNSLQTPVRKTTEAKPAAKSAAKTMTTPKKITSSWKDSYASQAREEKRSASAMPEKKTKSGLLSRLGQKADAYKTKVGQTQRDYAINQMKKSAYERGAAMNRVKAENVKKEIIRKENQKKQEEALKQQEAEKKKAQQRQIPAADDYRKDPRAQTYIDRANEGYNVVTDRGYDGEKTKTYNTEALMQFPWMPKDERRKYEPGDVTYLNEDERNQYSFLLGKYGAETANAYLEQTLPEANKRETEKLWKEAYNYGLEHPVKGALANTAYSYQAGIAGIANLLPGSNPDPNSPMFKGTQYRDAVRRGVSDAARDAAGAEDGSLKGNTIDLLTNTAMSMLDTAARLPLGYAGLGLAGGDAAGSAYTDALERGATNEQAKMQSAAQGIVEAAMEKLPLDSLKGMMKEPIRGVKSFIKNLGRQMATEGAEEGATELTNAVTDQFIMGEASNFNSYKNAYIDAGYDETEAGRKALADIGKNVLMSAAGGAISGLGFGGAVQAGNTAIKNMAGKASGLGTDISYQELADAVDTAPESYADAGGNVNYNAVKTAEDTRAYAQELADREAAGETINNLEKADLQDQIYRLAREASAVQAQNVQSENTVTLETSLQENASDIPLGTGQTAGVQPQTVTGSVNEGFAETENSPAPVRVRALPVELGTPQAAETEAAARQQWQSILERSDFTGMQYQEDGAVTVIQKAPDGNIIKQTVMPDGQQTGKLYRGEDIGRGGDADILFAMPYATQIKPVSVDVYYDNAQTQNIPAVQLTEGERQAYQDRDRMNAEEDRAAAQKRTSAVSSYAMPYATDAAEAAQTVSRMPEAATAHMVELYDGTVDVGNYIAAYRRMYNAGRNNVTTTDAQRSELINYLTPEQMKEAYKAGAQDRYAAIKAQESVSDVPNEKTGKRLGGIGKTSKNAIDAQKRTAELVGKRTGLRINVTEETDGVAEYNSARGEITISPSSRNFNQSLAHELTHYIQDYAPKQYRKYKDTVISALMTARRYDYDTAYALYEKTYEGVGVEDTDEITDEMAADAAGMFLNDENFIRAIVEKDRSIAEKIRDFFADIVDAIKALISREHVSGVAQSLYENQAKYRTALGLWSDALEEAAENYRGGAQAAENGKIKYSIQTLENGQQYVEVDTDQERFDGLSPKEQIKEATRVIREKFSGKTFGYDENKVTVTGKTAKEYKGKHYSEEIMTAKARLSPELENLMNIAEYIGHSEDDGHHPAATGGWDYYRSIFRVNNKFYTGDINVMNRDEDRLLYDVYKINEVSGNQEVNSSAFPVLYAPGVRETSDSETSFNKNLAQKSIKIKHQLDLNEPVEETKTLVAVHNLTTEKLEKMTALEGMPMPSIAVTKAVQGWDKFGDISFVFDRSTIDPEADRRNKVYGADAWTPTVPQIDYEYDDVKLSAAADKIRKAASALPEPFRKDAERIAYTIDNDAERYKGYQDMVDQALEDTAIKAAYLADQGETVEDRTTTIQKRINEDDIRLGQLFLEKAPEYQFIPYYQNPEESEKIKQRYKEAGKEAYREYLHEKFPKASNEKIEQRVESSLFSKAYRKMQLFADRIQKGNLTEEEQVRDVAGMEKDINRRVDQEEYRAWVEELFSGVEIGTGVWNGKEYLTPTGNRRSFKQLHYYPVTAENIVKAMLGQNEDVRNTVGFMGAKSVRAVVAEDFKSVDAMHKAEGKLQQLTDDEFEAMQDKINNRLDMIVNGIIERKGSDNIMAFDSLGSLILDVARKNPTAKNIETYLKKYNWSVTAKEAQELVDIIEEIKDMPVDMFEAKPQRVVGWDEIRAALVPENADSRVMDILEKKGIENIVRYDPEKENDRRIKLQSLEGVRFQLNIDDDTVQNYEQMSKENELLRKNEEYLTAQLVSKENWKPSRADIRNTALALKKETGSYLDTKEVEERLTTFYNWIHNSDYLDGTEVSAVAASIAGDLLSHSQSDYDKAQVEMFNALKTELRGRRMSIPMSYDGEFSMYGGLNMFRRKYFGIINLQKNGAPVDQVYQELHDRFPEYFPDDIINQADQLIRIGDVVDSLRPKPALNRELEGAAYEEATYLLGQKIMDAYYDVRYTAGKDSYAQKRNANLKKYREQIRQRADEQIRKVREKNQNRIQQMAKVYEDADRKTKEYYWKRMDELRNDRNQKLQAQTERYIEQKSKIYDRHRGQKYKEMIQKDKAEMTKWLLHPTDKKHVPEILRKPLAEFLNEIDFTGNKTNQEGNPTQRYQLWLELQRAYQKIVSAGGVIEDEDGRQQFIEVDDDIIGKMEALTDKIKNSADMNEMTSYQLQEMKDIVRAMKKSIVDANKALANKRYENIQTLGDATISEAQGMKEKRLRANKVLRTADRLMNNQMLDSFTRFKTFGDASFSIYEELREGFNRKVRRTAEAETYFDKLLSDHGLKQKDIRAWSGKNAKMISITTERGEKLELKPSQVMSLYELLKREQAKKHIFNGGIKAAETLVKKKNKIWTSTIVARSARSMRVTQSDVLKLIGQLTEEQKAVADGISRFFTAYTSKWGNEVSMQLYGYEKFNAGNYFPIVVDKTNVTTKDNETIGGTQVLRNIGMTKATTPQAANPLMIEDIFDVYTRQVDQMGSYNAFVVPLSDMQKWLNYRRPNYEGSVKNELEIAYGKEAVQYVRKLMEDINGVGSDDRYFANGLIGKFKASAVGANLRVVIQQPTAYVRAAAEVSPKYLLEALPKSERGVWDTVRKYSAIAQWKDWGYFDTKIGKSMKEILTGPEGKMDQLRELQMKPAGWGDQVTWAKLWQALELEVKDRQKDLKQGSDAFYKAVAKRFDEVIDATQVVDSVLHRSELMRSKNDLNQMATSFMSEPTKAYNMLYRSVFDLWHAKTDAEKKKAAGRLAYVGTVWALTAAVTAAFASIITAVRDDDKEKKFGEKYVDAFAEDFTGNINLINMVPFARDVVSLLEGYDVKRADMNAIQEFIWAGQKMLKFVRSRADGEETAETVPYMMLYAMKPISSLTGIAFDNAVRDGEGLLDTFLQGVGADEVEYRKMRLLDQNIASTQNTKTYMAMALRAYAEGNEELGAEIIQDMLDAGIPEDKIENQYSEQLKGDERLNEAAEAKLNGNNAAYQDAIKELVADGYPEAIVESRINSAIDDLTPYSYEDIAEKIEAAAGSSTADARPLNEMISEFAKYKQARNGWDDKKYREQVRSQLTKYFKPKYIAGNAKERNLILRKLRMLTYKGVPLYDEDKDITSWAK